jgi:hypothetical protein
MIRYEGWKLLSMIKEVEKTFGDRLALASHNISQITLPITS